MSLNPVFATYDWRAAPATEVYQYCPYCGQTLTEAVIDHRLRPTCTGCGFVHFKNPAPGISVFVVDGRLPSANGRVLLTKRNSDLGGTNWALPSGYIEYDEDYLTAAMREVKEETGLDVVIEAIINVESGFVSPRYHFLTVYLLAHVVGGELAAGDDATAVDWFPLAGPLPEMAFAPDVAIIRQYTAGTLAQFPIVYEEELAS
ncbi:MAG: NUDIX hydrolase [Anaerolineae bacterium]